MFLSGFANGLYAVGAFNMAAICAAWAMDNSFAERWNNMRAAASIPRSPPTKDTRFIYKSSI